MFRFKKKNQLTEFLKGPRHIEGEYKDNFDNSFYFPDQVSFAWTYKELFEKKTYFFQTINDDKRPLIIDCGANIGVSLVYFKMIFPECRIIAFEPDPFLFNYLDRNIKANNLDGIKIYRKAVWNKETNIEFYQEKSDSGRLSMGADIAITKSNLIQVDTCLLSQYITGPVEYLKIDIEGAEWEVIKEIEKKIKFVKRLFIESHSFISKKQDLHKILALLSDNNFRYYLTEGAVVTHNPFLHKKQYLNMDLQINIHAIRED